MNEGYVKIYRTLSDNWIWDDKPFSKGQAWIDLIMLADYQDYKKPYKGTIKTYKRGSVNMSISKLAERWGWSRKKTRNFLNLLENDKMVSVKVTTNDTTVTIVNYGVFQDKGTTKGTQKEQRGYQRGNSEGNTLNKYKANKEDKEEKEKDSLPPGAVIDEYGTISYVNWDDVEDE